MELELRWRLAPGFEFVVAAAADEKSSFEDENLDDEVPEEEPSLDSCPESEPPASEKSEKNNARIKRELTRSNNICI